MCRVAGNDAARQASAAFGRNIRLGDEAALSAVIRAALQELGR